MSRESATSSCRVRQTVIMDELKIAKAKSSGNSPCVAFAGVAILRSRCSSRLSPSSHPDPDRTKSPEARCSAQLSHPGVPSVALEAAASPPCTSCSSSMLREAAPEVNQQVLHRIES